jgi:hypothetical protein
MRRTVSTRRVPTEVHLRVAQHALGPITPYLRSGRKPRPRRSARQLNVLAQSAQPATPRIIADDFARAVPVSAQELEVIETYFSALLNELIGTQE